MDKEFWANAFAMPRSERRHDELIAKIARGIARRRLAFPAILALESVKPLNYLASQALIVRTPALGMFDMENKKLTASPTPKENNQPVDPGPTQNK